MPVHVIATGGTIAADGEDVLAGADLLDRCGVAVDDVRVTDVASGSSSDLTLAAMVGIAEEVRLALATGADGVVVVHGTDTLEQTLYLTHLLAGAGTAGAGVVFTGAMRRADHPQPDGPANLADAIALARHPQARHLGAVLCMDRIIHGARFATKVEANVVGAFSSAPGGPLGRMTPAGPVIDSRPALPVQHRAADTAVALVSAYPGMGGALIDAAVAAGAHGVVLEGWGACHVPESVVPALAAAREAGVAVVVASRARCDQPLDAPLTGDPGLHEVGAVSATGLPAPKALMALMVALGDAGPGGVPAWFARHVHARPA